MVSERARVRAFADLKHRLIQGTGRLKTLEISSIFIDVQKLGDQVGVLLAMLKSFLDKAEGLVAHLGKLHAIVRGEGL
jgi:hypothetical protein